MVKRNLESEKLPEAVSRDRRDQERGPGASTDQEASIGAASRSSFKVYFNSHGLYFIHIIYI